MKLHLSLNRSTVATITASVLLTGLAASSTARDRNDVRRMEPRTEQKRVEDARRVQSPAPKADKKKQTGRNINTQASRQPVQKVITVLPRGYRTIATGGKNYYYHNGVYYLRDTRGYKIVSAPRIVRLPRHTRRVVVNRTVYYVDDNLYYYPRDGYYEVCEAPHVHSSIEFTAGPVRVVLTDSDCCSY